MNSQAGQQHLQLLCTLTLLVPEIVKAIGQLKEGRSESAAPRESALPMDRFVTKVSNVVIMLTLETWRGTLHES